MENQTYITFNTRFGDVQSAIAVDPHIIALSELIEQFCNKRYSPHFDQFVPIGKVDGTKMSWGYAGCDCIRLNKEQRYVTIDIGMPRSYWFDKSALEIRTYLYTHLEEALQLMVGKIKTEQMHVDEDQLFEDFSLVKQNYLQVI